MNLNDVLRLYFTAHPNEPIPMATLAELVGVGGWRNRVTDLRLIFKMDIRCETVTKIGRGGRKVRSSNYRYIPVASVSPSEAHDANAWGLR